jgi:uncharacterized membrane protein YjjP (DUF1212 family)/uncharacterized membrane protein YjjB (DUF3815 family)
MRLHYEQLINHGFDEQCESPNEMEFEMKEMVPKDQLQTELEQGKQQNHQGNQLQSQNGESILKSIQTRPSLLERKSSSPWSMQGTYEGVQIQLLIDLAGYLIMYGAPLYRVKHRIAHVSKLFDLPLTAFYLPNELMVSVGHYNQKTSFLYIPSQINMEKLEGVDRICKDLLKNMVQDESLSTRTASVIAEGTNAYERIANELAEIVNKKESSFFYQDAFFQGIASMSLIVISFKGNLHEAIITFFLGSLSFILQKLAGMLELTRATPIFVSFAIAFLGGLMNAPGFWKWANYDEFCEDYVVIASLMGFYPGSAFALSMLEFTFLPSASGVRLFLAFMRSFQIGYGIAMGSKLSQLIIGGFGVVVEATTQSCPTTQDLKFIDLWRVLLFPPMMLCVLKIQKASRYQWPYMLISTTVSFLVSFATKPYLANELSTILSSMSLGLTANVISRWTDHPAICAIYAGIFWQLPGAMSVVGSASLITGEGGSDFGLQIMLKTLSLSVGFFLANIFVFPLKHREASLEFSLAV